MKWSFDLARVAGISVRVHATFFLLLAWVAWAHWTTEQTLAAVLEGVAFICALFACVVLHEYGHALTARRYGIATRDITLYPIGGVARLEKMPEEPRQELIVALMGPAVNVVIAGLLAGALAVAGRPVWPADFSVGGGPFVQRLLVVNIFLVVFNLIPAFPMDGGRVLRAVLASRMPRPRATRIAASVGQGLAYVFGLLGLIGNPFLLFIALFVWVGAAQEAAMVQVQAALAGMAVRDLMLTRFRALRPGDPLGDAVELTLKTEQKDFPVLEQEDVVGVLTQQALLQGLAAGGARAPVSGAMRTDCPPVGPAEPLEKVLTRMQEAQCPAAPVAEDGRLVGLLTMDNVGEYLRIRAATEAAGGPNPLPENDLRPPAST